MHYEGIIEGKYVDLKSATVDDAEFTKNIRQDPDFSPYFPPLNNTIEQQRAWIESNQKKEGDYFFVVWDKKGERIGTIAVYDFNEGTCESGRLAIRGNAFQCMEAQLLLFDFAFYYLNMDTVLGYIFADNARAIRFNKQLGGVLDEPQMHDNGHLMVKATYNKNDAKEAFDKIKRMMYR